MTTEREKLIACIMDAISEHGKLCGPEEIADAILAAGFRLVTPTSEGEAQQAARELMESWAEICKDKLPRAVPASVVCARYILSLAPGKDVVEGARPFAALGGDADMQAFHDLPDDVVIYENSGSHITAGDVRSLRNALAAYDGKAVSAMNFRRSVDAASENDAVTAAREVVATYDDGLTVDVVELLLARYILSLAPGKAVVEDKRP